MGRNTRVYQSGLDLEGRDIIRRRIDEPRADAAERRDHVVEVALVVPATESKYGRRRKLRRSKYGLALYGCACFYDHDCTIMASTAVEASYGRSK